VWFGVVTRKRTVKIQKEKDLHHDGVGLGEVRGLYWKEPWESRKPGGLGAPETNERRLPFTNKQKPKNPNQKKDV